MTVAKSTSRSQFKLKLLFALAFLAAPCLGQVGMVRGTVVDSDLQPIAGAKITVTSEDLGTFRKVVTSNERGVFRLRFSRTQAQYRFDFLVEKPGFQSFTQPVSASAVGQRDEQFVMETSSAPVVESRGDLGAVVSGASNEAIEAFNAGVTAQRGGDVATAKAHFEAAIESDPELAPAYVALAHARMDGQEYEGALEAADRALGLAASPAEALRVKYDALRALGRAEEAEAVSAELEKADSAASSALRLYNEGGDAFKAGDNDTALAKFGEAAQVDPSLVDAHHAIATLRLAKGDFEGSASAAEKALALGSEDVRTLRVLYDAYDALGRTAELTEIVPRLAAVDPEFGGAKLVEQAGAAWNAGDTVRAVSLSRLALSTDPDLAKAYYFIGLDHLSRGENAQAKAALEAFLDKAPDDVEAATAREMLGYIE